MRFYPSILEKVRSGQFFGSSKPIGRVSVEPLWNLNQTPPSYGGSNRGPYRWFQDTADSGVEWEVPNIKNISWDRSESQDIATCTITLYNMWHEGNLEQQELVGQLGKPGYFWPKRGLEVNRWGQIGGTGSFRKDGFWDPNFSWQNVLIQYGMIRTYEGYGGHPTADNFKSIQDNLDDENVLITGTWLIDTVTAGSNGEMVLNCKDMGKLLLEQICFPPTIPSGLYPLDYYPAGKSAFDSVFGPKPKTGVSVGSQGEVRSTYVYSSLDDDNGGIVNTEQNGHFGSHANDGNWNTYALSEAHALPGDATVFWDFDILDPISKLSIKAWAGGYECYVSIMRDNVWLAGETVPGLTEPYITKINIPMAIPDNQEPVVNIELPDSFKNLGDKGYAQRVKISLRNLYYSGIADGSGNQYRAGIRDLIFYRDGAKADPYDPNFASIPWTFSMCSHPTRGYWVIDTDGNVYGFGDAADYDSTAFGPVPLVARSGHSDNQAIAMCSHPDGKGYWVLDRMGHVFHYGSADFFGEYEVAWPGSDVWGEDGLAAWDIAPTYTGNGYWVCYGDGSVRGFGDATPDYFTVPVTDVATFMNTFVDDKWLIQHQLNGICGHPTKMGGWVTSGSGEVWAFGEGIPQYGQLDQRVYNRGMADEFRLAKTEYTRSIESTASGNGYWIAFGSGHIAAFGDAVGQGPTFVYPDNNPDINIPIDETNIQDWSFFRALVWDIARDPDGTGFWVLVADGHVGSYSAEFWGEPGYNGLTGYRWHEGNFDGDYCVDTETEILTKRGWLDYKELVSGDIAYSINPSTGLGEWKSVSEVNIFESKSRKMLKFEHQTFSSLTTLNHNWLYKDWKGDFKFRSSSDLREGNRIPRSASLDTTTKVFDDDFVELMAWFIAEGWPDAGRVRFAQSSEHNPEYHDRIVSLLIRMYGEPGNMKNGVSRFPNMLEAVEAVKAGMSKKKASKTFGMSIGSLDVWLRKENLVEIPLAANWGLESLTKNDIRTFSIRKDHSENILRYTIDGKVPSIDFVNQLTSEQAQLFLNVFCMGDGNDTTDIYAGVSQKREATIDMLQVVASIAGIASCKRNGSTDEVESTRLCIYKSNETTIKNEYLEIVNYDGIVWCPTIEDNSTWLARRNGVTYFTGNSNIIRELLAWSGFTFYNPAASEVDIFGAIESTGIKTDTIIAADKFDKRSILDIIKELCEVVAYRFLIQEDGSVKISSPNIWRSGNFDIDGIRIYVDGDTYNRVESTDPDAVEFIPLIDEEIDMFDYSTTLSSEAMRSEIIIGNDLPDPKNPSSTAFVRHAPRSGSEQVAPGIKMLRDIPRVGMWISQLWQNTEEMQLMAELISLNAWFAERTSTATCVANPCLSLGDQVKFAERNTSEYNIHYISGINSNNDLDTGVWTYNLTSHWLGDANNWVITANQADAPVDGYHYIQISERVDRWQQATARGLERGGQANGSITDLFSFDGQFVLSTQALSEENWEFYGELTLNTRATPQVRLDTLTSPLGSTVLMKIYQGSSLIITKELTPDNLYHALPEMGADNTPTTFSYVIEGVPLVTGNGVLGLSIRVNQESFLRVSDTLLITN